LPSPIKHLVPEPYRSIPDETVEAFYATCMDPEDNVFDMQRFEQLCKDQVRSMDGVANVESVETDADQFWTVIHKVPRPLSRPFSPPEPFSDRMSRLRPNNRIRLSRSHALCKPRPRSVWNDTGDPSLEIEHSDPGPFLTKLKTVDQVDFRVAYQKNKKRERKGLRKVGAVKMTVQVKPSSTVQQPSPEARVKNGEHQNPVAANRNGKPAVDVDVPSRMEQFKIQPPPTAPIKNLDGETAMAVLKQLGDLKLIGEVKVCLLILSQFYMLASSLDLTN